MNDQNTNSMREQALKLLALREHSCEELKRKLVAKGFDESDVHLLLNELIERGWQSDLRFAHAFVLGNAGKFGRYRLEQELRERGIDESTIALMHFDEMDTELVRARDIWYRKYGEPPIDERERAKQARFLQSRGFSFDVIRKILNGLENDIS